MGEVLVVEKRHVVVGAPSPEAIGTGLRWGMPLLRPYQMEAGEAILDSVRHGRGLTFTVVMARQAGKNELSAQVELRLLTTNQFAFDAIKCAPTFDPQCRISIRRLWSHIVQARLTDISTLEVRTIQVGAARQLFLSAEPSANVVGHTAELLLEVDEAQDVDREKFEREFRPMAAATGATTVLYGTPWDESTLLEETVQANLEAERRDGIRRHFSADWTAVAEFSPVYAQYVEAERARLGEEHPLFRTQYALKTIAGGGRLFSGAQKGQLQGDHARRHAPEQGEVYVAGLDLAGESGAAGRDATVLTIGRVVLPRVGALVQEPRLEIDEHLSLKGVPHDELFARLADVLGQVWRVRCLVVDATGLGETLSRLLSRTLGGDIVQPLRFTAESKSRLGYELIAAVNGGRLKMYAADGSPEYTQFWREMELARVAYRPNQSMNFFVEPSRGHDDYVVSLALALAASRGLGRPRVARGRLRDQGSPREMRRPAGGLSPSFFSGLWG